MYEHDPATLWQLRPLEETILTLWRELPSSRELAMAAGVAAKAELTTGQMARAGIFLDLCHNTLRQQHKKNPDDREATRLFSVSLNSLGDFLARRGQAGDGDKALGFFQRSLEVRE